VCKKPKLACRECGKVIKPGHFSARKEALQKIVAIYGRVIRLPATLWVANLYISLFLAVNCQALSLRRIRGGDFLHKHQ
jgi:hypothetical protein